MRRNWLKTVMLLVLVSTIVIAYGATNSPPPHIPPPAQQANEIQDRLNALRAVTNELSGHLEDMRKHWYQVPPEQKEMVNKIEKWTREERPKLQAILEKVTAEKWDLAAQSESRIFNELAVILGVSGFVLTVLGVLSYQVLYNILKATLDKEIRDRMAEEHIKVIADIREVADFSATRLYNGLSMMFSEQYHDLKPMTDEQNAPESQLIKHLYRFTLKQAISLAEASLGRVESLDRQKYERQLFQAKHTLAYHLATRNGGNDFDRALTLSKEVFGMVPKYRALGSNSWYYWVETHAWVLSKSSESTHKNDSTRLIADLMRDTDIEYAWRNTVCEKYRTFYPQQAIDSPAT